MTGSAAVASKKRRIYSGLPHRDIALGILCKVILKREYESIASLYDGQSTHDVLIFFFEWATYAVIVIIIGTLFSLDTLFSWQALQILI